uniref:Tumor protein p53-inducible protein 11 n=12 Tax=Cercopithecidae TaxID=9527 RepID=F6T7A6_MACMU
MPSPGPYASRAGSEAPCSLSDGVGCVHLSRPAPRASGAWRASPQPFDKEAGCAPLAALGSWGGLSRPGVGCGLPLRQAPSPRVWELGRNCGKTPVSPLSPSAEAGLEEKMAAKQPPPLMKKHSQTDLVSRLKTRKILGVGGEDDDGEVHRSKISQVLGNEIKFTVREPLGLRVWQFVSAVLFSGIAIMALAFPDQLYDAVFDGAQVTSKTPIRLYGGALLSISLIMWNALYTAEKVIIRWTLLTEACYFGVQFLVVTATLAETGLMSLGILLLLVSRLLFVAISIYYYYQVGRRPKKA